MPDRILATHVGSLPRGKAVTDLVFGRERGEKADGKFDAVAEPHEDPVAWLETFRQKSARGCKNGGLEFCVAKPLHSPRRDHGERGFAAEFLRTPERVGCQVERNRAGGQRTLVEDVAHAARC